MKAPGAPSLKKGGRDDWRRYPDQRAVAAQDGARLKLNN